VVSLSGKQMYLWRAVDGEGEVLEILVQPRRDKAAAMRPARALSRRLLSLINCDLTARPFVKLAIRDCMSKAYVPTTARRTRISRFDDESERCKASNQPDLRSASFLFMPRSTIHSMFNGI
jgi:transposase-like protein